MLADCVMSWLCARAGEGGPDVKRACMPAGRAGVRAGEAAGFFAAFSMADLTVLLSALLAAAAYLASTVIVSDLLVTHLAWRWAAASAGGASPGGASPGGLPGAGASPGLSVVTSRAECLRDMPVSHLMVPRKSIVSCDSSTSVEEVASIMTKTGLSRVIVFRRTLDAPLGLAHIKDVLPLIYEGKGRGEVEPLLRPLILVPSTARAGSLLSDFQRLKRRVAIVRDLEGERTLGLVSTEDILEEMVGEIRNERETPSAALETGVALVRGDSKVRDLIEDLGMAPDFEVGDVSLRDLVKSLLDEKPGKGDVVHFGGLRLEVEETVNGEVWMVRVGKGSG